MKKCFVLVLILALTLSTLALAEADNSLQAVLDKGVFVLGLDATFAPMGFTDENGDIVGFDVDCAAEVCKRLGVELVLQPIDWAAKELELNGGNIDCIWNGMTATEERAQSMSLSIPYMNNAQVVCVLESAAIQTLADMAGKTVAVQAGSSGAEAIEDAAEFKAALASAPAEFSDYAIALMDLDNRNVDGVVGDIILINYYKAQKNAPYRVLEETLANELYAIGFRKTDGALTEKVNEILKEMAADGALAEISAKWFGEDITIVAEQ